MNKYIAEAIGTFALVFCGTGAIIIDGVSGGGTRNCWYRHYIWIDSDGYDRRGR